MDAGIAIGAIQRQATGFSLVLGSSRTWSLPDRLWDDVFFCYARPTIEHRRADDPSNRRSPQYSGRWTLSGPRAAFKGLPGGQFPIA
jgi:hypothetical protein